MTGQIEISKRSEIFIVDFYNYLKKKRNPYINVTKRKTGASRNFVEIVPNGSH